MNELIRIKRKLFDRYYQNLNDKQREAVYHVEGPLLVVAGAGSGKTTVLVNRIAHIIRFGNAYIGEKEMSPDEGELAFLRKISDDPLMNSREALAPILSCFTLDPCPPDRILAITFTNKAAGEIKERLASELGNAASAIWAGTFHSICVRLLRRFSDYINYSSGFLIYDQDDCKKLITSILKEQEIEDPEITPRYVMNLISRAKNAMQDEKTFSDLNQGSEQRRLLAGVYSAYQKELKNADAMDFDDIIMETVLLLKREGNVRAWCNDRFRYILVDEYQDTNHAQSLLLQLLTAERKNPNIMAVGDDDQSIYKFRGAAVENILNFDKTYSGTRIILLEQNYRSTRSILEAANALIAHNDSRRGKSLWCENDVGKKVAVRQLEDQEKEAVYIADKIGFLAMQKKYAYKDIAVLYRTKAQSNMLETVFTKSGIPHRLLSGTRFVDRAEVKDVLAYLRLIINPADTVSFTRIINVPRRGIGLATVDKIRAIKEESGENYIQILSRAGEYEALGRAADKLTDFYRLIASLTAFSQSHSLADTLSEVLDQSGYIETLQGKENEERKENVEELFSSVKSYAKRSDEPTLSGFLEEMALISDVDDYDENADAVVLMTVHAAKGLEFPVVFLTGMEENIFPSPKSAGSESDLEEERRLAYVAMTRAKKELFITCTQHRMLYGRTSFNEISRFVREIPEKFLDMEMRTPVPRREFDDDAFFLPKRNVIPSPFAGQKKSVVKPAFTNNSAKPATKTERFVAGDKVIHPVFGAGTILSAKDYASDTLYVIEFENGETKKLMSTYAKLTRN
ncbi:MAG: UvrD-helicase domain-containing protein [Clostridia bacterium]|nr:UvrD-helicase domain-containing protein [Clostridia bacterium]